MKAIRIPKDQFQQLNARIEMFYYFTRNCHIHIVLDLNSGMGIIGYFMAASYNTKTIIIH